MKFKPLVFILFLFHFVILSAQVTNKQKEIPHTVYGKAIIESTYQNKKIVHKRIFTLNKQHTKNRYEIGEMILYYDNGKIKAKGNYYKPNKASLFGTREIKKEGEWFLYDKKEQLLGKTSFKDNREHGSYVYYHKTGKIEAEGTYVNGVLVGTAKKYFTNGQLHRAVKYEKGKIYNVLSFFNKKGKKLDHGTLKEGNGTLKKYDLLTGNFITTYTLENGVIENVETKIIKTNKGNVVEKKYKNRDNSIQKIVRKLNDTLEGKQEVYSYLGKLKEIINYTKGVKNGKHIFFSDKGTLFYEYNYINGKKTGAFKKVPEGYAPEYYALEEGRYNDKEELTGEFTCYLQDKKTVDSLGKMNENRFVILSGTYKDGKKVGLWKTFDEKGKLLKKTNFTNNDNDLYESKKYYNNSKKLKSSVKYNTKKNVGVRKEYYVNEKLKSEISYKNEVKDGLHKEYYEDGQLKVTGEWKEGDKIGNWKEYNQQGLILKDHIYTNHCCFATTRTDYSYRSNGELSSILIQDDHKQNPSNENEFYFGSTISKKYYKNGNLRELTSEKKYKYELYGVKDGIYQRYSSTGKLEVEGNYKKDKKEGVWRYYNYEGKLNEKITYLSGNKRGAFEKYEYYKNKEKSESRLGVNYDDKYEQTITYYHENGKIKEKGNYIRVYKDSKKSGATGNWEFFHKNGKLASKGSYENGKKEGKWKYYYDNGICERKGAYKKGLKIGDWKFYYKSGKIEKKGAFIPYEKALIKLKKKLRDKAKIGKWEFFNDKEKLKKTALYTISENNKYLKEEVKEFYSTGRLKFQGVFKDGEEDGVHQDFFESGRLKYEITYKEGYRSNVIQYYDVKDRLKIEMQFDEDGYILNVLKYFDVKGKKLEVGTLKNGTGTIKYYDKNNKVIKIEDFIEGDLKE